MLFEYEAENDDELSLAVGGTYNSRVALSFTRYPDSTEKTGKEKDKRNDSEGQSTQRYAACTHTAYSTVH